MIIRDGILNCKRVRCIISKKKKYKYNAYIYSQYYFNRNINKTKHAKTILCNLEALSYKLLYSKHQISQL